MKNKILILILIGFIISGCIGVGSPGFYLENNENRTFFSSRYSEKLPTYDAFDDKLKENIIILEKK